MPWRRLATLAVVLLALPTASTFADDGDGGITVNPDPQGRWDPPRVDVGVHTPGRGGSGQTSGGTGATVPVGQGSGSGNVDQCYWVADPGPEAAERGMANPPDGAPPPGTHLYARLCPGGVLQGWRWLTPAQAGVNGPAPPSPAVLAQRAYRQLVLAVPVIRTSPAVSVPQLVGVPTWLWIDPGVWSRRSRTAAVAGLSATATARPVRVRWSTGDGSTVVCRGPGTSFRPGVDRAAAGSPDCGHTYLRSSAGAPGGVFMVTATIEWSVSWAGGGQAGTLPALTSTSSVVLRVTESQALND
jgi:hypothetical protein